METCSPEPPSTSKLTYILKNMAAGSKKKFSIANRRLRERSNFSFLFVLFFFALFCIIILMETVLPKPLREFSYLRSHEQRSLMSDDDEYEDGEDYDDGGGGAGSISSNEDFNLDITFEEKIPEKTIARSSSTGLKKDIEIGTHEPFKNPQQKRDGLQINENGNNQLLNSSAYNGSQGRLRRRGCCDDIETDWQQVTGSSEKFYIYSAYFVTDHIKVIGATRTQSKQHVQCRFYDNQQQHFSTVDGRIKTIRENWNLRYSACFIICNLPSKEHLNITNPTYISITAQHVSPSTEPTNHLKIQYASDKLRNYSIPFVNFSLCVKPIYLNYDNVLHFLEMMEFHRLMGVEHFTFFNHSIGPKVGCIMNSVYNSSIISILPWTLPFVSQKEIRTEGIFTALNDCVYRHRGMSKYLVIVDLDEAIVPRKAKSYFALIDQLEDLSKRKKVGAYSFQNAFFYLQFEDDPVQPSDTSNVPALAQAVGKKLLMLRKTRRRARFHPHKERSKYICDPNRIIEAGNHFIWEMEKGYYTLSVPPTLAALHHYRVCEFGGSQCIRGPSAIDKSIKNFVDQLVEVVASRLEEAASKCDINIEKVLQS